MIWNDAFRDLLKPGARIKRAAWTDGTELHYEPGEAVPVIYRGVPGGEMVPYGGADAGYDDDSAASDWVVVA